MRATILSALLAVGLVTLAGLALAENPKPPLAAPPAGVQPVRAAPLDAQALAALRAQKPLTLQQKTQLVLAGRQVAAPPVAESPFTLSAQNTVLMVSGAPAAAIVFHKPQVVAPLDRLNDPAVPMVLLTPETSDATIHLRVAGDRMYLVDCSVYGANIVSFNAYNERMAIGRSTASPQAGHATFVVQKLGAPHVLEIVVTGATPLSSWTLNACEVTPFQ